MQGIRERGPRPLAPFDAEVFEGPEKKLEIYLDRSSGSPHGLRSFQTAVWADVIADAQATILHRQSNAEFDAYLLSESSLFVFSHRIVLKTCGTTTLLLVLPKLLRLAEAVGTSIEHLHYGHYRLKFPSSRRTRTRPSTRSTSLERTLGGVVTSHVLGPRTAGAGTCSAGRVAPPPAPLPADGPVDTDDIFEIAMEGWRTTSARATSRRRTRGSRAPRSASRMTAVSGVGALLPGVTIDDWAFEPCGYSMNGLQGEYYYTVHVTPEDGFSCAAPLAARARSHVPPPSFCSGAPPLPPLRSYASFETNDPSYRRAHRVQQVVDAFQPSVLTLTLTTRRAKHEFDGLRLRGYERNMIEVVEVLPGVKVCAINFAKLPPNPPSPDNVTSVAAAAADVAVEKGAACGWCAAAEPSALPAACGHRWRRRWEGGDRRVGQGRGTEKGRPAGGAPGVGLRGERAKRERAGASTSKRGDAPCRTRYEIPISRVCCGEH